MIKQIDAVFDGRVLRPTEPLELNPQTRVRLTIEITPSVVRQPRSFLRTARLLNLQGPRDWSERIEDYLYGRGGDSGKTSIP